MSSSPGAGDDAADITLTAAAEQLGVHYMTAYRYVRTGRMVAEKRGGQWWVRANDLAAVLAEGTGPRRRPSSAEGDDRALPVQSFVDRLIAGDTAGCWGIIEDELGSGAVPSQVHNQLLRPALIHVGSEWHAGNLRIADEHRATSTAYRLMGQLGPLFRHRGRRRGTVIVGACEGDSHALPSAMLADLVSDRRFDVIDLGANTPTESFIAMAGECDDLVGIGICAVLDEAVPQALQQAEAIRTALPNTYLLAGGPAIVRAAKRFSDVVDEVSLDAEQACRGFDKAGEAMKVVAAQ